MAELARHVMGVTWSHPRERQGSPALFARNVRDRLSSSQLWNYWLLLVVISFNGEYDVSFSGLAHRKACGRSRGLRERNVLFSKSSFFSG